MSKAKKEKDLLLVLYLQKIKIMELPEKSVERISQYRRILTECDKKGKTHIYSHELAGQLNLTPVQVRRDVMLIGYSGTQRKGYVVNELKKHIDDILNGDKELNIAVVGMGNLGRAVTTFFNSKHSSLNIVAGFESDEQKTGKIISGVRCYHINEIKDKIKELDISIAILTLPPECAQKVVEELVVAELRGILNFTSTTLNVPPNVYVENYDVSTYLEKVAYFVNHPSN